MPVLGCGAEIDKLMQISDGDIAIIEDVIAERLSMGVSQAQAQRQAVDEALAQLGEERSAIMKAVDEQLGKEESKPVFSNKPTPEEILAMESEEITIDSPKSTGEYFEKAANAFLSSFPEGTTKYDYTNPFLNRVEKASRRATDAIGEDATAERVDREAKIGPFVGYSTTGSIEIGLDGREQLVVELLGREQVKKELTDKPALKVEVNLDGEFSIYGPPSDSDTYKEFYSLGWAEPARGKDGAIHWIDKEAGTFWTRLTGTKERDLLPFVADVHARVLAWKGEEKTGLYWHRETGATGGSDGRNTAVYFSNKASEEKDLILTHNLTSDNLIHADKMGGIAVPSLAVTHKSSPLAGFGDITLIGHRDMADPKGYAKTKVFGADIYSPRYPSVEYHIAAKDVRKAEIELASSEKLTGSTLDWAEVKKYGVRTLEDSPVMIADYLKSKGVEPNIVMEKGVDPARLAKLKEQGFGDDLKTTNRWTLEDDPAFIEKAANAQIADYKAMDDERYAKSINRLESDDQTRNRNAQDYAREISEIAKKEGKPLQPDRLETRDSLRKQVDGDPDFKQHVQDFLYRMNADEKIFKGYTNSGNRTYMPHTLENVVKILKKDMRGGEGFNYGVGSLRAKFTPEFKSISDIRANKDRLTDKATFEKVKEDIGTELFAVGEAMGVTRSETLIAILEDAPKMGLDRAAKQYGVELDDNAKEMANEFLTKLKHLPTEYFEAKILRDVGINEFHGAVIHQDTPQKARDILAKHGLETREYSNEADRAKAVESFADELHAKNEGKTLFSNKAQTETPEFKKWFGDSAVVDDEGRPLVVYHGTGADFNVFDRSKIGENFNTSTLGFYFTNAPKTDVDKSFGFGSTASEYAKNSQGNANVMPVYLSIKKPLFLDDAAEWGGAVKSLDVRQSDIARWLKSGDYDGVISYDGTGEDLERAYVVFDPTQIKSATGNNGQFDASNPDIRYSNQAQTGSGWDVPDTTRTDAILQKMQDGRIDLKRAQQAIEAMGKPIAEEFDARLAETLYAGRVADRSDTFLKKEVKPLLESMAKNNVSMDEISDYLLARHAPERNLQIAKINDQMPDGGAGSNSLGVLMTNMAARGYIAALTPSKLTLMRLLASRIDSITKGTTDLLLSEGLETQSTIDAWLGAYKNYVPLFKDEAEGTGFSPHPIGSGISTKGNSSKRAMGSEKEVTNMLAHVLMQREAAITRGEKNRVGLSLYGLALTQPNTDFWATIKPSMSNADIASSLQAMGIDPAGMVDMDMAPTIRTIDKATGKVVNRVNPLYKNMPNAIVVKVEGVDRVILFSERSERAMRLVQNLKNLDGIAGIDLAGSIIGQSTRFVSSMSTQYNPAFGAVNIMRDVQGALVNLSSTPLAGMQAQVLGNVPDAIIGISRDLRDGKRTAWSDLYVQFRADGGQTGFRESMRDPHERSRALEKELKLLSSQGELSARKAASSVLELMDGFNTSLENSVRLSAYKVALDSGMSRAKAARLARELTVDFNRKGSYSSSIGPLYAFFNAAVQGTARTVETLKGPAGKKIIAGGLALGMAQALMMAAAGFDDDEIAEFSKARAFIIPLPGKTYISIPLPLGLHVLPNTGRVLTELLMSKGEDWDKKTFSALGEIAGAFNPLGGGNVLTAAGLARTLSPTVLDPVVELAMNKNFAGTPISKQTMPGDPRPGYLLGREKTQRSPSGEVYKGIAEAINLVGGDEFRKGYVSPTPEEVKYVVMAIGGGLLREIEKGVNASILAAKGEEVPAYMIPLGGRFSGEVDDDQLQQTRFYKNKDKIGALKSELMALSKSKQKEKSDALIRKHPVVRLYEANDEVNSILSELNKIASENINNNEALKRVDVARAIAMRKLNEAVNQLEKASDKEREAKKIVDDIVPVDEPEIATE